MYLEAVVVDSLAHVVRTNSINLQHCIKGAYIIQTAEIHTLSVLRIPVLKALEDSALAGHRKFPAAAINIFKMAGRIHYAHKYVHNVEE